MDQELDFGYRTVIKLFEHNGEQIGITTTIINTWIIMAVLIIFAIIVRMKLKSFTDVPTTKFQNIIEALVEAFGGFTVMAMGKQNKRFAPFYGSMFVFILLSNLSGLVGLRPPTADIATTFALSMTTFVMIQGLGLGKNGFKHIKALFEPMPLLFPLNLIGELANPISLGFRLFGNIIGGTIIMGLLYAALPKLLQFGFPSVLHLYFDVFSGALQTFIFVMLSMTFVSGAIE